MTRQEAVQRLRRTTDFTFVAGRVRITDARMLAVVRELRAEAAARAEKAARSPGATGGAPG